MSKLILRSILVIAALVSIMAGTTTAYFSDSAVISGNVFSTGTWSTIVINEVYYMGDKEWVELYNTSDTTVDIKGWSICNSLTCGKLNPEKKTEVPAGGYVLVSHDANDLKDLDVKDMVKIYYAGGKIDFKDAGDSVILKDIQGNTADEMSYTTAISLNESLSRIPNGEDTDQNTDFQTTALTPGLPN